MPSGVGKFTAAAAASKSFNSCRRMVTGMMKPTLSKREEGIPWKATPTSLPLEKAER